MDDHNFRFSITLISAFWQLKHKHHICKYYILANITVLSQKQINSPIVALLSLNSFNNSMNNNPKTLWIPITTNWLKKDAGTTSQLKPLSRVVLEQTSRFILYGGFGLRRYSDYNLGRRLLSKSSLRRNASQTGDFMHEFRVHTPYRQLDVQLRNYVSAPWKWSSLATALTCKIAAIFRSSD